MQRLYEKALEHENIIFAMKNVLMKSSSNTPGPDGMTKEKLLKVKEEIIIKETKNRIRRRIKCNSRKIEIPKGNSENRTITIINLYDRIAQTAVNQVISPIIEPNMSRHSFGFRIGVSAKVPVSRLADILNHGKNVYTVELDFKKCFDNIPLESALKALKDLGVKDRKLIKTVKHLMYTSKEYLGVGLSQGTVLGPILANCYLNKLDRFMESEFELETQDPNAKRRYEKHKGEWVKWVLSKGRKIHCRYYRYADDTFITCGNVEEQAYIAKRIKEFIDSSLEIEINEDKSKLRHNIIEFLGFRMIKSNKGIWIYAKNEEEIIEKINNFKFNSLEECLYFEKWFYGILRYYDIVNDLGKVLKQIENRLYARSLRTIIHKEQAGVYSFGKDRNKHVIEVWGARRETRVSFKEYLFNSTWIKSREWIELMRPNFSEKGNGYSEVEWILFTKQKGKDIVTKKNLDIKSMRIHHIKPVSKGGSNSLRNLILINEETHKLIHNQEKASKEIEKYRKHLR